MGCLLLLPFFFKAVKARRRHTQSCHHGGGDRSSMQSASTPTFFPFFSPSEVERGGGGGRKGKIQLEKDEEGRETGGRYARYGRVQSSPFFIALPSPHGLLCSPGLLGPFSFPPSLSAGPSSKEKQYLGKKEEGIGAEPMQCCAVEL